MANSHLYDLVLEDKWPGVPNPNLGIPLAGFDGTTHHDVTAAVYPIGTKIQIYSDATKSPGYSTLIYLDFHCVSGKNSIECISAGWGIVQQFCNSVLADGTRHPFHVTNVGGIDTGAKCATNSGIIAFACGSITDADVTTDAGATGHFGWGWCGGVCPYDDITFLNADITTDGNVAGGKLISPIIDTSQITIGLGDTTSGICCGIALSPDA